MKRKIEVGVFMRVYYYFNGKRFRWLDLDVHEAAYILANGFVVKGGRWFWGA
jgi:hypothetical protein